MCAVKVRARGPRRRGTTRISSKNQVTLPVDALKEAALAPGAVLVVKAAGPGRIVLERSDDPIDRFASNRLLRRSRDEPRLSVRSTLLSPLATLSYLRAARCSVRSCSPETVPGRRSVRAFA